jgi:hypothetical protein
MRLSLMGRRFEGLAQREWLVGLFVNCPQIVVKPS